MQLTSNWKKHSQEATFYLWSGFSFFCWWRNPWKSTTRGLLFYTQCQRNGTVLFSRLFIYFIPFLEGKISVGDHFLLKPPSQTRALCCPPMARMGAVGRALRTKEQNKKGIWRIIKPQPSLILSSYWFRTRPMYSASPESWDVGLGAVLQEVLFLLHLRINILKSPE